MAARPVLLPGLVDLQTAYDHARFLMGAYANFADDLGSNPAVCTHLETVHEPVDAHTILCRGCGRTVPVGLLPEDGD
ncbi:MAG TPA: hypothetical protein VLC11_04625 [Gemmatimonadales bacterium]|nr:hypothetical protein [Gemmatimonadales bacterium]